MYRLLFVLALSVTAPTHAFEPSDVDGMTPLFADDFDDRPDWTVGKSERCARGNEPECDRVPSGWTHTHTTTVP